MKLRKFARDESEQIGLIGSKPLDRTTCGRRAATNSRIHRLGLRVQINSREGKTRSSHTNNLARLCRKLSNNSKPSSF